MVKVDFIKNGMTLEPNYKNYGKITSLMLNHQCKEYCNVYLHMFNIHYKNILTHKIYYKCARSHKYTCYNNGDLAINQNSICIFCSDNKYSYDINNDLYLDTKYNLLFNIREKIELCCNFIIKIVDMINDEKITINYSILEYYNILLTKESVSILTVSYLTHVKYDKDESTDIYKILIFEKYSDKYYIKLNKKINEMIKKYEHIKDNMISIPSKI